VKVFISWSGDRSKLVALKLREWLPIVVPNAEPWLSQEDIRAGATWLQELRRQLERTDFGILCLTPGNLGAPWLLFEAGALAKRVEQALVCPYLIGFADFPTGPLGQFQGKLANKEDTWIVVRDINATDAEKEDEIRLRRRFEALWPELELSLDEAQRLPEDVPRFGAPSPDEKVEELLKLVRGVSRIVAAPPTPIVLQKYPTKQSRAAHNATTVFTIEGPFTASEIELLHSAAKKMLPGKGAFDMEIIGSPESDAATAIQFAVRRKIDLRKIFARLRVSGTKAVHTLTTAPDETGRRRRLRVSIPADTTPPFDMSLESSEPDSADLQSQRSDAQAAEA
jgi:hypothetical protein